jgi:hypothetical protein
MLDGQTEGGSINHDFIGNGLTGPGEGETEEEEDDDYYDDYDDNKVSIFNSNQRRNDDDESTNISVRSGDRSSIASSVYPHPKELPDNSSAADFVRSWACHLQKGILLFIN